VGVEKKTCGWCKRFRFKKLELYCRRLGRVITREEFEKPCGELEDRFELDVNTIFKQQLKN